MRNGEPTGEFRPPRNASRPQRGFAYLAVLFAVALLGLLTVGVADVWHTIAQREKEAELLFIGNQFRQAIGRYYESSPGAKAYPARLDDLLEDKRFPNPQRHLRKLYRDPMTGSRLWGLVKQQERIVGVFSLSDKTPLKTGNFAERDADFDERGSYSEWKFVYRPDGAPGTSRKASMPVDRDAPTTPPVPDRMITPPAPTAAGRAAPSRGSGPPAPADEDITTACEKLILAEMRQCTTLPEDAQAECYDSVVDRSAACLPGSPAAP